MTADRQKYFLVLEPNADDAFLIDRAFRALPFCSVFLCRNASEARAYLNGAGQYSDRLKYPFPSGIITGLRLGMESALEFISYVRNHSELSHLPITVLHGGATPTEIESAKRLGVNDLECKPPELSELKNLLRRLASNLCS